MSTSTLVDDPAPSETSTEGGNTLSADLLLTQPCNAEHAAKITDFRNRSRDVLMRSLIANVGDDAALHLETAYTSNSGNILLASPLKRKRSQARNVDDREKKAAKGLKMADDSEEQCRILQNLSSRLLLVSKEGQMEEAFYILHRLESWPMTLQMLRHSSIGRAVNLPCLRKSSCQEVARRSQALIARWRHLCQLHPRQENAKAPELSSGSDCSLVTAHAAVRARCLEAAIWDAAFVNPKPPKIAACLKSARRQYLIKVRFLTAALRRLECAVLCRQVLKGSLNPADLVHMSPEEFLSHEQKSMRERERHKSLQSLVIVGSMFTCFSERLECPSCGARGARYATPGSEE